MAKVISETYRALNASLHTDDAHYGVSSQKHAGAVASLCKKFRANTVLDYGCGKGLLKPALAAIDPKLSIREYDPAMPGKDKPPKPADFVCCLDVMEHIEPDCLDAVLDELKDLTKRGGLLTIAFVPAMKILPDGRNAHLILQPKEWWLEKLGARFDIAEVQAHPDQMFVVIKAKAAT